MVEIYWNNKQIIPYESFYWTQTERFFHGTCGDGNSRTITAIPGALAICEIIYEDEYEQKKTI